MEDRYIGLQLAALVLCMVFTVSIYAQRQAQGQSSGGVIVQSTPGVSQETRDALQDAQLSQIVKEVGQHTEAIGKVREGMNEINGAIARLNSTGFAFGSLLSGLLALDVYFRIKTALGLKQAQK